jgi:D-aminoacyl-tRNA deacylase
MRAVLQRVSRARVLVDGRARGEIGPGLCVLLGIAREDTEEDADRLAVKVARLRIFEGESGKFELSLLDSGGAALVVSQFTLVADTAKGTRPSFSGGAQPDEAKRLFDRFCAQLAGEGIGVETGVFGARMQVELANDGPVTIIF